MDCKYPNKKGLTSYNYGCRCLRCRKENTLASRDYYHKKPENKREANRIRSKEKYKLFPDKKKEERLKYQYNLTLNQYKNLLLKQNYTCAICETTKESNLKELAVDHNHKTGKIRGLLCDNCNKGLGFFKDNQNLLIKATEYLNVTGK